jgi:hypothetical protein
MDFSLKIGYIGGLKWKKFPQTAVLSYIFIYIQIIYLYIIPYTYLTNGEKFKPKKVQYNYSTEMFIRRAKPIWTIGDPDNQCPDMRSSTVIQNDLLNMQGML